MYFHVMVGSNDIARSSKFYDAVLGALGVENRGPFRADSMMYGDAKSGLFLVTKPINGDPATYANGGTIMFRAKSRAEVDAFYKAGVASGGSDCLGAPKDGGLPKSYMGYLRDPDGNKIAAVSFD
jgi:catechol 2,3-dioxygenase-like lactoylglutathione lyase family enzyme